MPVSDSASQLLVSALAAFGLTLLTARWLLSRIGDRLALDIPNARSLHRHPVPRIGGLAMAAGVTVGWGWLGASELALPGGIALFLVGVSLIDDLRGLPVTVRLTAHLCAAVGLIWMSGPMPSPWLAAVLVVGVIWAINLYNFMDGSDGLAGGMAVSGFGFYALAAGVGGESVLSAACAAVAASGAAFLVYNFHPARLFLGDSGAVSLGFLAAALGLLGWRQGVWTAWLPVLVFSPFIADASVTLGKRVWRGERLWLAHREHYYQRLVLMGLGHRGTALLEYALMLGAGLLAMWTLWRPDLADSITLAWFGGLAAAMVLTDRLWVTRKNIH